MFCPQLDFTNMFSKEFVCYATLKKSVIITYSTTFEKTSRITYQHKVKFSMYSKRAILSLVFRSEGFNGFIKSG